MKQLGSFPAPSHTIAHLSDVHLLAGGAPQHGVVNVLTNLHHCLDLVERCGRRVDALLFTGDLTDLGEPAAYEQLRDTVAPFAHRLGAQVIWVMGNHDERTAYAQALYDVTDESAAHAPQCRAHDVRGLRIIALDSTVPGWHHGELGTEQLDWLREQLRTPAEHGTLVALHHPPIPSPIELMAILELQDQDELGQVIAGTDVRGVLAGHLHYSTHSTLAGVPVSVSGASCYSLEAGAPGGYIVGVDGGQSFDLVDVYEDRIVHSRIPIQPAHIVSEFGPDIGDALAAMPPDERLAAFGSKSSTWRPPT